MQNHHEDLGFSYDFPMKYGDLPGFSYDFPMKYGDLPGRVTLNRDIHVSVMPWPTLR